MFVISVTLYVCDDCGIHATRDGVCAQCLKRMHRAIFNRATQPPHAGDGRKAAESNAPTVLETTDNRARA